MPGRRASLPAGDRVLSRRPAAVLVKGHEQLPTASHSLANESLRERRALFCRQTAAHPRPPAPSRCDQIYANHPTRKHMSSSFITPVTRAAAAVGYERSPFSVSGFCFDRPARRYDATDAVLRQIAPTSITGRWRVFGASRKDRSLLARTVGCARLPPLTRSALRSTCRLPRAPYFPASEPRP